jgi:cytochrome c oxidase subunit 2
MVLFAPSIIGFQDPATPIMEGIIDLHNYIFFYLTLIFSFVLWVFLSILIDFYLPVRKPKRAEDFLTLRPSLFAIRNLTHSSNLEIVWTLTPSFILMLIAIPSFALLYAMDEVLNPMITFKAIGHQWYWSYEFSDYIESLGDINFDSNMLYQDELSKGEFRLLSVDNPVILPINTHVRVIITSMDVLHSWAVPSLGVKVDGCPGRLNQAFIFLKREGVFYGQCSELCGVNHAYMPIVVKGVSLENYLSWIKSR